MTYQPGQLEQFDGWLRDDSDIAALVIREWLEPVEGRDAVIFPPTYTLRETDTGSRFSSGAAVPGVYRGSQGPYGYNMDVLPDGSTVVQIDSVGSQANRMEPIFKREPYRYLVPQVLITAGNKTVNLLDAGHRAGDAIVRFADRMEGDDASGNQALAEQLWDAFQAWQDRGDAEPLARIAPTSIVFGVWDSRATQAKLPRIVRSVIRAYGALPLHRSAQFGTPLHYVDEGLIDEALDKGEGDRNPLSQEGFRHSPAPWAHGGVAVVGEIRRDASVNLVALRTLGISPVDGELPDGTTKRLLQLRRYILGLSLVALTQRNDQKFNLREGCLLRTRKSDPWKVVPFEGAAEEITIKYSDIRNFALAAAEDFGVQRFSKPFVFNNRKAEQWLKRKAEERDKLRRRGPVVTQEL